MTLQICPIGEALPWKLLAVPAKLYLVGQEHRIHNGSLGPGTPERFDGCEYPCFHIEDRELKQ